MSYDSQDIILYCEKLFYVLTIIDLEATRGAPCIRFFDKALVFIL